jgi:hypothetical protein
MSVRTHDVLWMGSGFAAALVAAAAILLLRGLGEGAIVLTLAVTARIAFLLFWPAYVAGALVALFGPAFQSLRGWSRGLGLAFVSALTVHLSVVGLLCLLAKPPPLGVFLFFGGAAICAYLLVLFSFDPLRQALGPERWRLLSVVAMNYLAYAFITDFLNQLPYRSVKLAVFYLPFLLLAFAAPALRLSAFLSRVTRSASLRLKT